MRNRIRQLAYIIMMLLASLSLMACTKEKNEVEEAKQTPLTIQEGVLTIGTQMSYAPMEFYTQEGKQPSGFDVEMAQAIAQELGMKLEIVDMAWDAIFVGLEDGKYDAIISGVSRTPDREEKYALTQNYLDNGLVLVVPQDSAISELSDINHSCIGVQLSTTADMFLQEQKDQGMEIELAQYENVSYAYKAMKRGEVDAICLDSIVAAYYLKNEMQHYRYAWQAQQREPFCICLTREDEELKEKIEQAMVTLKQNGTLSSLSQKYFGEDFILD